MTTKEEITNQMAKEYYIVTNTGGNYSYVADPARKIRQEHMNKVLDKILKMLGVTFEELTEILHRGKDDGK